jgi:hypothetical protein
MWNLWPALRNFSSLSWLSQVLHCEIRARLNVDVSVAISGLRCSYEPLVSL